MSRIAPPADPVELHREQLDEELRRLLEATHDKAIEIAAQYLERRGVAALAEEVRELKTPPPPVY